MSTNSFSRKSTSLVLGLGLLVFLQGCGLFGGGGKTYDPQGDLVGAQGRPQGWIQTVPYGMVPIPAGTFHMGQADQDITASMINFNKQITIGPFSWMTPRSQTMSIGNLLKQ